MIAIQRSRGMNIGSCLTFLFVAAASVLAETGPRLEVSQREWDFGKLWVGDPCSIEITLRNVGDQTLRINDIKSSCGCTTAEPKKRALEPGESDSIKIRYDTKTKKTDVKQTITLITNDPVEPEIKIQINGKVNNVFDCKPFMGISFGKVATTTQKTEMLHLTNNMPDKVYPKLLPLPPEAPFEIELVESEPGMKYDIKAKTKPPLQLGNNHYVITLETGVEKLPKMEIDMNARALDRVQVWPDQLRVTETQTMTSGRTIYLYYTTEQPVKLVDAKSNVAGVSVKIVSEERPNKYSVFPGLKLNVAIPPFSTFPETGAVLELITDDPDPKFQKFVVPIEKYRAKSKQQPPTDAQE